MDKYIELTPGNVTMEHICCAMADKKSVEGVQAKKEWLTARMAEGLKFVKLDARGKVFIEYLPAESAWVPIEADGYMYINCHWVSGSFKGKGYGVKLLEICEKEARGMNGVVLMTGKKKKIYMPDKAFYLKQGYEICDTCDPDFELLVKRFNKEAALPRFRDTARQGMGEGVKGIDLFYTAQCPFTVPYIRFLQPVISASDIPVRVHHITTQAEARNHVCPVTTYSIFVDGKYYSNEILTPAKLEKLLVEMKRRNE